MSNNAKATVMRKLMAIDRAGLLSDMRLSFANECRIVGGRPADNWRQTELTAAGLNDGANVVACAEFAADALGCDQAELEAAAAGEFMQDRWSEIFLRLVDEYYDRVTNPPNEKPLEVQLRQGPRNPTAEEDANWNPWAPSPPRKERKW